VILDSALGSLVSWRTASSKLSHVECIEAYAVRFFNVLRYTLYHNSILVSASVVVLLLKKAAACHGANICRSLSNIRINTPCSLLFFAQRFSVTTFTLI
jgi:hypothetical protein